MKEESSPILKWKRAAKELGVELVAPFLLLDACGAVEFAALLPQFGSSKGMLIMFDEYRGAAAQLAQASGYGFSCLSESEERYDVEDFVDVLNDWGWGRKDATPPGWYTGVPWTA